MSLSSMTASPASGTGPLSGIDVAVLAGGLGTRIRAVLGDVPKVLAPVGDQPFLAHLLDWLRGHGATRVVLCLGHLADKVEEWLQQNPPVGMQVVCVVEPAPMGTAGAIRFARPQLLSDPVFVLNGDTFVDADLSAFVEAYRRGGNGLALLAAAVPSIARFGSLDIDPQGFIRRFVEKDESADRPGTISAGMYLFSAARLDALAAGDGSSLERDVFQLVPPGTVATATVTGRFIDIGTPDSLAGADKVILNST
jgi:NDP-sugar pyrophosphorylase family protein